MSMKRVTINAAVVIGTLALIYLLWVFRAPLVIFLFSLAFAAAARPGVESLLENGVPRGRAILIVYALFFAVLLLFLLFLGNPLLAEIQQMADRLVMTYDRIWAEWPEGTEIQRRIVEYLPAPEALYSSFSSEQQGSVLNRLLGITVNSFSFLGHVVTAIILSIYWSADQVRFERLWLSLLPVESRARARDMWRGIEHDFGLYIRSEVMQSIVAGMLLNLGLWAMGVNYPTLLSLIGALAWLVPWLGGVLSVLPITLVALSQSPELGIFATAYAIGVLFFLELFIEPRFIRRRQFSSLLSILLIIALVEPFGLMGFLVAPPLAAAIELVIRYNLQSRQPPAASEAAQRIPELRARLEELRAAAENSGQPLEPQTMGMLERLETLIDQVDEAVVKGKAANETGLRQPEKKQPAA